MRHLPFILLLCIFCGDLNLAMGFSRRIIQNDGTYDNTFKDTAYTGGGSFSAPMTGSCRTSCNSSQGTIQVDVRERCMCISGSKCFRIDIGMGYSGSETTNGVGKMAANVNLGGGGRYQSKPYASTSYDNDAISMGIFANTKHGKWIHKSNTEGCGPGGARSTAGCIGVPCQYWPEVKQLGKQGATVQVCNGSDYETSKTCGGRCSSSPAKGNTQSR